ncbi:sterile alpha motif domain-containing protein 15-like [Synchiropus splendidus]|uniref:sterile alpha motif domain-containing protein 15-like n=1 Tax=Synchiropus splendidus TaxID=270530 RepID=UPI00237DB788|nr:sterile alpha motif domain-containing protein 15-like [Synchiropus splendidus]
MNTQWRVAVSMVTGNQATENMEFLQWSCNDVARWIEAMGFPQYAACFSENCITGRKLILVDCAILPKLGITDFKDMQAISANVRELLGITGTPRSRSIADPRRDHMGLYLERKSKTGEQTDRLTFQQYRDDASPSELNTN